MYRVWPPRMFYQFSYTLVAVRVGYAVHLVSLFLTETHRAAKLLKGLVRLA